MAITGAITAAATIGGAVVGNQQKQKAKGDAAAAQRDAQAAQDAADKRAKEMHDAGIQSQSQAAAVGRKALGGTIDDSTPGTSGTTITQAVKKSFEPPPPNVHTLLTQPIQRKALIGQ